MYSHYSWVRAEGAKKPLPCSRVKWLQDRYGERGLRADFKQTDSSQLCLPQTGLFLRVGGTLPQHTHQALRHPFQRDSRWWMKAGWVLCSSRL